jgi:hypothetical protein
MSSMIITAHELKPGDEQTAAKSALDGRRKTSAMNEGSSDRAYSRYYTNIPLYLTPADPYRGGWLSMSIVKRGCTEHTRNPYMLSTPKQRAHLIS